MVEGEKEKRIRLILFLIFRICFYVDLAPLAQHAFPLHTPVTHVDNTDIIQWKHGKSFYLEVHDEEIHLPLDPLISHIS